jgi:hypothetical protein
MPSGQVIAHYEPGLGIRPPRRGGKVRGVARELEPGGGMELWHCDHDHAPGVHDVRELAPSQRAAATRCARDWLVAQIRDGHLHRLPVQEAEE